MLKTKVAKRTCSIAKHKEEIYEFITKIIKSTVDVLDLGFSAWPPEHPAPNHIVEAAKRTIEEGSKYRLFGLTELKEAIATKLEKENGIEVNPEKEVLITTGGGEAISLAIWTLINPSDEVIMADPGYVSGFEPNVMMAGGRMIYVPAREERNFKADPEDVEEKVTKKTKMIIVITPNNPTGAVLERKDLEGIAEIAVNHDLIVLSDEIFEKLVYDGRKNLSIGAFPGMKDRTLTINGFSKSYNMPGYRVGYIAGPELLISKMANIQLHTTSSVSDIGQAAALAALTGPQDWIEDAVIEYGKQREALVESLNRIEGIKCMKPEGGFTAFPNLKEYGLPSLEIVKYLLKEAGVRTGPGSPLFGANAEGYIKVVFWRSWEIIEKGLERMRIALEKLRSSR